MTAIAASQRFEIGRVIRRTFGVLSANFAPFLLLSVLFVALPSFLGGWLQTHRANVLFSLAYLLFMPVKIAAGLLLQTSVVVGASQYLEGETGALSDWVAKGLRLVWPAFLLSILVGLVTAVAALAFVVPAFIVAVRWSAAMPALVLEDLPVTRAMARSAVLTKGRRWAIFGLMLLLFVPVLVVEMTLIGFATGFQAGFNEAMIANNTQMIILPLLELITSPLTAAGLAALYLELTPGREGARSVKLAQVFD